MAGEEGAPAEAAVNIRTEGNENGSHCVTRGRISANGFEEGRESEYRSWDCVTE